jgi:protein SDA1
VSSAAMHIFLGESNFAAAMLDMVGSTDKSSKSKKADPISSDEEDGSRRRRKKPSDSDSTTDFTALDSLIEPYSFTESILKRAMNNGGSFEYRLLALRVVCRAVYRRELVLPNLYPYLEKYLFPSNRHVTKILACLAQACHANVPPDEMQSVVRHVLNNFVSDHCRPEVITVGLNALRGICERAPLALNKDQLMDIVQYRNMKTSKSVAGAARALLNLYRDIHPELLHKSLRGKQAAIAVQRGETERIAQFGEQRVETDISGIDLLVAAKKRKRMDNEEQYDEEDDFDENDEEEEDEEEEEEEEEDEEEEFEEDDAEEDQVEEEDEEEEVSDEESRPQISLATETILSNEDFRRIKKLKSIAAEKGSIDSDDLMSSSDSGSEDGEEEVGDWILNPEKLGSLTKKGQEKKGDATEERKRAMLIKAETRRGGLTNKEKKRMKPLMMSIKKEAGRKRGMSAGQKFKQIRNHISNLKKQIGPQKRRRSGKFSRK